MRLPFAFVLVGVLLLVGGPAGATSQASHAGATATAYGIKVVVPGQAGASSTSVSAPANAVGFAGSFAYPSDGSIVTTGTLTASATTDVGTNASSSASSQISSVSLFGGEVTIGTVTSRADGRTTGTSATGDLSAANVSGFTVGGAAVNASPNGRVQLGDWGYAITLEQAQSRGTNGKAQNFRGYVTAVDIRVTAQHGNAPPGTEIQIGYAETWVQAGTALPKLPKAPDKPSKTGSKAKAKQPKPPEPTSKLPVPSLQRIPQGLQPKLTAGGYVFPVFPSASFVDTFGGFRGDVPGNWHHGDDLFASLGAPILACADGTIFSVGWNDVGGNRLWLRDGQGNEFYYAHLSAYSPAARNGNRVKAGEVIGFVGNTGDAEGTPYHLHFEVHPVSLLALGYDGAVDPTPYLTAWQHQKDIRLAQVAGYLPGFAGNAPKPGAILLQSSDISEANGLDPESLRRALQARFVIRSHSQPAD